MAAISMCFQLIADEIVAKFKWIGEKLGIKKKEEEEDDKDSNDGDDDDAGKKPNSGDLEAGEQKDKKK